MTIAKYQQDQNAVGPTDIHEEPQTRFEQFMNEARKTVGAESLKLDEIVGGMRRKGDEH